jgi:hypothetical protein
MSAFAESPIRENDLMARFIISSRWIRSSDQTVKQDAFIPHPYPDLSVTLHGALSDGEMWAIGESVAIRRPANLYGRADIGKAKVLEQGLFVKPDPVSGNTNHALIINWPQEKAAQKILAQELASVASFIPRAI